MRIAISSLIVAFLISGCSSGVYVKRLSDSYPVLILDPALRSSAVLGEVMIESDNYSLLSSPPKMREQIAVVGSSLSASAKLKSRNFTVEVPSGEYVLKWEDFSGRYFTSPLPPLVNGKASGIGGVYVPKGSSTAAEIFWNAAYRSYAMTAYSAPIPTLTPVSITSRDVEFRGIPNNLRRPTKLTLTYAGVAGDQIKFAYKEFTESGYARPAFTQEVVLDYKPGETYAYKDARFVVHSAGPTTIEFTLLQGL